MPLKQTFWCYNKSEEINTMAIQATPCLNSKFTSILVFEVQRRKRCYHKPMILNLLGLFILPSCAAAIDLGLAVVDKAVWSQGLFLSSRIAVIT